jgi:membrane-associated phospholipid phosphatase
MHRRVVKSWALGLALSFVIVSAGIVGVHTPLQVVAFLVLRK